MEPLKKYLFKNRNWVLFSIISIYAVFIRLPQIYSQNFLPDTDECVIGMMGNHLLKGENFPIFFYGQTYGLSTLEATLVSAGIFFGGISAEAIKLPMLLLYLISLFMLFRYVEINTNIFFAFFITLLFAAEPTWLSWAMKARGGYLTALLIGFLLLVRWSQKSSGNQQVIVNGVLLGLLFHSHLIWFLGWFPAAIYYQRVLTHQKKILALISTTATIALFWIIGRLQPEFWNLPESVWHGLPEWEFFLYNFKIFLSGHFYYSNNIGLSFGAIVATKIWLAIHALLLVLIILLLVRKNATKEMALWFLISVGLLMFPCLNYNERIHFRYWLPFSAAFIVFMFQVVNGFKWSSVNAKRILLGFMIMVGFWGYRAGKDIEKLDFYEHIFPQKKESRETEIRNLISALMKEKNTYLFCRDVRVMWLLNYYSDGKIFSRFFYPTDRYWQDVNKVNENFKRNKQGTVIGFLSHPPTKEMLEKTGPYRIINDRFYLLNGLDKESLQLLEFSIP